MRNTYISDTNCITPLGFDVASNVAAIAQEIPGIRLHCNASLSSFPFYASIIDDDLLNEACSLTTYDAQLTRLEKMLVLALKPLVESFAFTFNARVGFILSTTKGNIDLLDEVPLSPRAYLHSLAKTVASYFNFQTEPIVVSNACVSGIHAIAVAKRLIEASVFDHVFVVAGDIVSKFVLAGFHSFKAMSMEPCKPFSVNRSGVTLGEAAAAVLVTIDPEKAKIKVVGAGSCNDANHISGPSRTGEGLVLSVESALKEAGLTAGSLDYISAHGTATVYNDEMEAIAFNSLGMENVPVNSFKGVYGHTLGASGLLEAIIGIESVQQNRLFRSFGFDESGVSSPINVIENLSERKMSRFLKTASGFGGCNTAVIFEKLS
ncbi:MAG: beta-ketoacyl synthase [Chitinophagaceae bacterium]|nr:MAG: beta-ketoacyl synthase [Chitinophagaceae bacterium]